MIYTYKVLKHSIIQHLHIISSLFRTCIPTCSTYIHSYIYTRIYLYVWRFLYPVPRRFPNRLPGNPLVSLGCLGPRPLEQVPHLRLGFRVVTRPSNRASLPPTFDTPSGGQSDGSGSSPGHANINPKPWYGTCRDK